jgi:hypothetical protein
MGVSVRWRCSTTLDGSLVDLAGTNVQLREYVTSEKLGCASILDAGGRVQSESRRHIGGVLATLPLGEVSGSTGKRLSLEILTARP